MSLLHFLARQEQSIELCLLQAKKSRRGATGGMGATVASPCSNSAYLSNFAKIKNGVYFAILYLSLANHGCPKLCICIIGPR